MKSLNRFQFIGNLTKDTELKSKPGQTSLAVFDIAVNGSFTDQHTNEVKEYTDYFQIKVWGKTAENAVKYLGKGSQVFVEGTIRNTQYTVGDQKRYGTDYTAEKIQFLNTKEPTASGNEN